MALLELSYLSHAISINTKVMIIVPDGKAPEGGWKTLYLLHGGAEDQTGWLRQTSIERYAERRDLVVIMPSGGRMSFWCDMHQGGKYFTFVADELPEVVGNMLPISKRREDTFVGGLSMGAYGAARFALSRPEQYGGAIVMSAGNMFDHLDVGPMLTNSIPEILHTMQGSFGPDYPYLKGTQYDLVYLAKKIIEEGKPCPRIYHTIGSQDGGYLQTMSMREYFGSLEGNPFEYTFIEHEGIHNWKYWDTYISEGLDYMGLTQRPEPAWGPILSDK